jgi:hypothetical protein
MKSQYPGIASLAAQVEMFGLSKRELDAKFTKSELALLAWRSQEVSASMEKSTGSRKGQRKNYSDAEVPEGLPDHFFDPETGELDLRRVTGEEAYKYMAAIGIRLPVMGRRN